MDEVKIEEFPFSIWLEEVLRDLYQISPVCIQIQMRDAEGRSYTSYWNVSSEDRAILIDAIKQDAWMTWLQTNKDDIAAILSEDSDDEEGGEDK